MKCRAPHLTLCIIMLLCAANAFAAIRIETPSEGGMLPYTSELLKERLSLLTGESVTIKSAGSGRADVCLRFDRSLEERMGSEGYRISTGKNGVTISSASTNGLLYGACGLIEWIMAETTHSLINKKDVDIDFPVTPGQAAKFFRNMPEVVIEEKPFYSLRGMELSNLALGVADLIDTPKPVEKYNMYSQVNGGYRDSAKEWKDWCDWLARHRMNFISNWPYSAGTNWWELAHDPMTKGTSIYSDDEIDRATKVREDLFKYARSRGLTPFMMNYVPGAATPAINSAYPEIVGVSPWPIYPTPFKLVGTKAMDIFSAQMKAIMRSHPSLGGVHLRWWGESFLSVGEGIPQLEDLTLTLMKSAKEVCPDVRLLMSGYIRSGGTKAFADRLPQQAIIQSKWSNDWEPVPDPNIPFDRIREFEKPFLISQALPSEEYQPIGGVQYKSLAKGISKYVRAADKVPNLQGFCTVAGEKDHEWITETNYITIAHLNWDPKQSNTDLLVRNYLAVHYGRDASDPVFKALELTQDVMEQYFIDFAGISPFIDCARVQDMFGLQKVKSLSPAKIKNGLARTQDYAKTLAEAVRILRQIEPSVSSSGKASFADLLQQTQFFASYMESRRLMADAFDDGTRCNIDAMVSKLTRLKEMDSQLLRQATLKPNVSDYFEMEGMKTAVTIPPAVQNELKQINEVLKPEYISKLKSQKRIFAEPEEIEVMGNVGNTVKVEFKLPSDLAKVKKAHLEFALRDLDGEKAGQEGALRLLGKQIDLEPTGDGQTANRCFELDPAILKSGVLEVEFVLMGKPNTAGYYVDSGELVMTYE